MSLIFIYISKTIPYIAVFAPVYIIIRIICLRIKKIKLIWKIEAIYLLFAVYLIFILSQTIVPQFNAYKVDGSFTIDVFMDNRSINLIPFKTIGEYLFRSENNDIDAWSSQRLLNLLANLLLFLPLGFFIPIIRIIKKQPVSLKHITIFGLIFLVSIEIIQFFIGRTADIDDIILNLIGILLGYLIFKMLKKFVHIKRKGVN